jgi:CHAP domain-containing protein
MSVLSRWRDRLRTRKGLESRARKRYIWNPAAANKATLKTRRAQVAEAERVIARHQDDDGQSKAVRWALSQVGVGEHPNGSNWGHPVQDWIKATGYDSPVPWCACFATEAATHGGAPKLKNGYCPAILAGIGNFKRTSTPRKGDFAMFKFPGVSSATADHIGVVISVTPSTVTCVEGNTSPTSGGSQNNGGGVYLKTRPRSMVAGWVRPPYPS